MRIFFTSLLLSLLSFTNPVHADGQMVVVELYTSQGCSSCPPADEFLTKLAKRNDVIALALHVDYWDYLGWQDSFADNAYSLRQRAYAKTANKRTVYTPQVIVQGTSHAVGHRVQDVTSLIKYHKNRVEAVGIELTKNGNKLTIKAKVQGGSVGKSVIQVVRYLPEKTVQIKRGENAGRRIIYSNIVTAWKPIANWSGRGEITASDVIKGNQPIVVIVQTAGNGPIIAAQALR